jgi:hypothetical protein
VADRLQRGLLDLLADLCHMSGVILPGYFAGPEIAFHCRIMNQRQLPTKYQPVKARESSAEMLVISGDKLVQGVFLSLCGVVSG